MKAIIIAAFLSGVCSVSANAAQAIVPPVWFTPLPNYTQLPAVLLNSVMNGNAAFQAMMSKTPVFKMYEWELFADDTTLRAFAAYLNAKHIKVAIEGIPFSASVGQPGYGIESFGGPGDVNTLFSKAAADGIPIAYVGWDEPWWFTVHTNGIYSQSVAATNVAASSHIVKTYFPNAKIGDVEPVVGSNDPVSTPNESALLQSWFTAYASANGAPFDFFQADIAATDTGVFTALAAITTMTHANGMTISDIIDGNWNATTDSTWNATAIANATTILSSAGLRPDSLCVQSWNPNPSQVMDPSTTTTLAYVAKTVEALASSGLCVAP